MSKDDGSLKFRGRVTPLMEVFLRRRSVRKYSDGTATDEQVAYVLACAGCFQERAGFSAPWLAVVPRGPEFDAVIGAATAGLIGKINPWLPVTKAGHLVLCGTRYPEPAERGGVEAAIKQAAMVMQVAVLPPLLWFLDLWRRHGTPWFGRVLAIVVLFSLLSSVLMALGSPRYVRSGFPLVLREYHPAIDDFGIRQQCDVSIDPTRGMSTSLFDYAVTERERRAGVVPAGSGDRDDSPR